EISLRRDVRAARQDLAVVGDLELDPRQRLPDRAELEAPGPVEGQRRARLGEPVALEQQDAGGVEELGDVAREWGPARHRPLEPSAERRVELREDELVGHLALELEAPGHRLAALLMTAHVTSDRDRPVEDILLRGRARRPAGEEPP